MGYETDITLEHRFAPTIKAILGRQFICQDVTLDREQATDFAVFNVSPFSVAARLRRYQYLSRYGEQFTLRWSRPSGVPTEIDKVRRGLVDYILYGFVDADERRIVRYFIGDFTVFRDCEPLPYRVRENVPPDSELAVYRLCDLPSKFVIKNWRAVAAVA
jgi:hypothetical protein